MKRCIPAGSAMAIAMIVMAIKLDSGRFVMAPMLENRARQCSDAHWANEES